MTELYSLEELNKKVNIRKRIVTIGALLPVFALLCAVLFCILVDFETLKAYKIIGCIISVACAWGSLYLLAEKRVKINEDIARLDKFLHKDRKAFECKIADISKPKTVADGVSVYEIFVDDKQTAFYYDISVGENSFSIGENIKFSVVDNYIVAYEVIK